tara:strand:+ start:522 stop:956 length:435 start_codon:yes stop_codon:yes gene_type:complete
LASGSGLQFDVVDSGTYGQVAERQGVPCPDFGVLPILKFVPYFKPSGGKYVAFFSVVVVKERNAAVTVWVIFDGCNRGGHSIFVPFEVDDAVALFMAATAVAGGSSTVVVSATCGMFLCEKRFFRGSGSDLTEVRDGLKASAWT